MRTPRFPSYTIALVLLSLSLIPASSHAFYFDTGDPDGKMAMLSRPGGTPGGIETEAADDFALTSAVSIQHATFTGLLVGGDISSINDVGVEIYRTFPYDSQNPPDGRVPTRVNSPSDVELTDRYLSGGGLPMTANMITPTFTTLNSVRNGIHPIPNQTTGGEGPITGAEVIFDVTFTSPFLLQPDHYFFVPQVAMSQGDFFWLSAPKPIVAPGTPFNPDLQAWIRNADLAPDWLRVGTDIVGGNTAYNATFSLDGVVPAVPEPATASLLGLGLTGLIALRGWRGKQRRVPTAR